jgi:uncharacterized protein YkwD
MVRAREKASILAPVRITAGGLAICMALGTGCAGGPGDRTGGGRPGILADGATTAPARVAGIEVETKQIRLSTPAVGRYGSPVQHALTAAETKILAGLTGGELRHEPGLSKAARELARASPDRNNVPSGLIDGVMAWVGLIDPPPRLAVVDLPPGGAPCGAEVSASCEEAIASIVKAARAGLVNGGGARWVGAGTAALADGTVRILVAVSERGVQIDAMANQAAVGGKLRLHGRLLGKRSQPSIEVIAPDGKWTTLRARVSKNEFTADVACDSGRGAYQVEVLAEGAYGPEVVANFPVYCGMAPPGALRFEVETVGPGVSVADVARSNFAALNNTRTRQGLAALQWDNAAAAVAEGHSQDMASNNFVGHTSPRTGDVEARFDRAGVTTAVLRENVARGYGPRGIHESLMASPGHRVNMLADDVTHVGIGAVIGAPETDAAGAPRPIFLTQNFYSKLGDDVPKNPVTALQTRVDGTRQAGGLAPIAWEPPLFSLAQELAEGVAAGRKAAARQKYAKAVEGLPYKQVVQHEVIAPSFASLDGLALWKQPLRGEVVGLGVQQVASGDNAGSLVVIVLVGER